MHSSYHFSPVQRAFAVKSFLETKSFKQTKSLYAVKFNVPLKRVLTSVKCQVGEVFDVGLQSFLSVVQWKIFAKGPS